MVYRRGWLIFVTGFLEPVFYLFSLGIGLGKLVDSVTLGQRAGRQLLGVRGAGHARRVGHERRRDRLDVQRLLQAQVRQALRLDAGTPLNTTSLAVGEIGWALIRGAIYSAAFLVVMLALGLVLSWWAVLVLPAAMLIGFAFAAAGMAATTYMRSWQDF